MLREKIIEQLYRIDKEKRRWTIAIKHKYSYGSYDLIQIGLTEEEAVQKQEELTELLGKDFKVIRRYGIYQ